jgi:hypothetical protein
MISALDGLSGFAAVSDVVILLFILLYYYEQGIPISDRYLLEPRQLICRYVSMKEFDWLLTAAKSHKLGYHVRRGILAALE